jgi:hypothetical protein
MKTRNTLTKLITITMAVAALAAAGLLSETVWLQPVEAQSDKDLHITSVSYDEHISYASIGIVPGERVRVSVANTLESGGNLTLSFQYYLAHGSNASTSVPFYESELIRVPPGEFRSSGVSRADLNTEGEAETGRAQMLVKVTMIAPAGSNPEDFPGSLEAFAAEVPGGESVQTDSKYRLIILAAKRSQLNAPMGFLPGQRLSYSFFNPNEEGSQPVRVQAYIYDSSNRLMTQRSVELRPGQFHTFNINRDDLRLAGEEGTGLLQVRAEIQVASMDDSGRPVKLSVSMERVDNRTGVTNAGTYFTGTVTVSDDGFGGYN